MPEDSELLHRYAAERSEEAFAELVRRHLGLVYSVALRQVGGDTHLAQDVSQQVFTDLARKAAAVAERPVLSAWLYRSTHFAASDVVRVERRRRTREQKAHIMEDTLSSENSELDWERIRPTLDAAIAELDESDRDAVALRFFNGCSFRDIGARLHLTDNAARMRVERALDKLRAALSRHGVTSTNAALAIVLAEVPTVAAPAGLAATITNGALAGALGLGGSAETLLSFMSITKIALGIVGAVAVAATGTAVYQRADLRDRTAALAAARLEQAELKSKLNVLEDRLAAESKHTQDVEVDNARLLKVVEGLRTSHAAQLAEERAPITRDTVEARYKHGQALARTGQVQEALNEFMWCFDEGMPRVSGYGGVRLSYLLSEIAKLGEPGLTALRDRRERARKIMLAGTNEFGAIQEFAALNRTLKEDQTTLAVFDQLPAGDPRRATLAMVAFEPLLSAQRYSEIAAARSAGQMRADFVMKTQERPLPANVSDPTALRKAQHDYAVTSAAKDVEVLAGVGDFDNARALVMQLLVFDGSEATHVLLQHHLTRAGHAELLAGPPSSTR